MGKYIAWIVLKIILDESEDDIFSILSSGISKKSSTETSNNASKLSIVIPSASSYSSSFSSNLNPTCLKKLNCRLRFFGTPEYHSVATILPPSLSTSLVKASTCISVFLLAGATIAILSSPKCLTIY